MFKYTFVLAAFTAFSTISAAADTVTPANNHSANAACRTAQLAAVRTDFPQAAQSRGEYGDVEVNVTIGKDGRAVRTHVTRSSGFPTLDRAATASITKHWRFDVASCAPAELPTDSVVTVQFERAPRFTVSGTINTRRTASAATNDGLPNHCDATSDTIGNQVIACVAIAPLANSTQQSLAKRTDSTAQK